jgi:CubicO group peptidase (beta-lactamase class C family)
MRKKVDADHARQSTIFEGTKNMKGYVIAAIAVYGGVAATTLAATPQHFSHDVDEEAVGTSAEKLARMDALLQTFVDEKKISSVVGLVAKDGQVVYHKAFGWKDVENRIPAAVDDYYVLFSQTKAIVSVAFMNLVEQGLLKLDDPVAKYFPEISDQVVTAVHEDGTYETRPVASPMTFAHLLSHSSGLNAGLVGQIRRAERQPSDRPPGFGGRMPERAPSGQHSGGGNYDAKYLKDEMLALAKYPLGFDPGTEWNYHVSTNMLGYMIERISGKPLREYVKETVLDPLGMNDTDWYYEPEALSRFVKPYRVVDGRLEPASAMYSEGTISREQTYCEGAIGLNGPIEDYAKFCQMLLNKGEFKGRRILKPETVELMTTINRLPEKNAGGERFQFGLGFELYNEHKKPVPEVSTSAFAWGGLMGTAYIIDPERDLIALLYINMYNNEPVYPEFLSKAYQLFAE